MNVNYVESASKEKPLEIDVTSSPNGVYVRRNIKFDEEKEMFIFQEAFITKSEYESYSKDLIVGLINDEENSAEYEIYKNKLDSGVPYKNGHSYKPKWTSIYYGKIKEVKDMIEIYTQAGGDASEVLASKFNIYDITAKPENAEQMSLKEIIELWLFLTQVQEQYFNEYKASLE